MLSAGKNIRAIAIDAGLSETKDKKKQQAFIIFQVPHEDGTEDTITWFGSLSEVSNNGKAPPADISIKALYTAGFVGTNLKDLELPFIQTFSPAYVALEIENNEYNGKTSLRVKWVNPLRSGPKKTAATTDMAGRFAKVRSSMGSKTTAPAAKADEWPV